MFAWEGADGLQVPDHPRHLPNGDGTLAANWCLAARHPEVKMRVQIDAARSHLRIAASAALVLLLACSSDEAPSPTTPIDTGTDVDAAIDVILRRPAAEVAGCRAGALLDAERNADLFAFLGDSLLGAAGDGDSLATFYGTYADTSASGSDGTGVARISKQPDDGIRLSLVGADSTGAPLTGSLTVDEITSSIAEGSDTIEIDAGATIELVESGGDDIRIEGALTMIFENVSRTPPPGRGTGALQSVHFEGMGNVCALDYQIEVDWREDLAKLDIAGSYTLDVRVGFHVCAFGADPAAVDSLTVDLWIGSEQNPLALATAAIDPAGAVDCVNGAVFTGGVRRADIFATGCGTDSLRIFVATDTDTIPIDGIFDGLFPMISVH